MKAISAAHFATYLQWKRGRLWNRVRWSVIIKYYASKPCVTFYTKLFNFTPHNHTWRWKREKNIAGKRYSSVNVALVLAALFFFVVALMNHLQPTKFSTWSFLCAFGIHKNGGAGTFNKPGGPWGYLRLLACLLRLHGSLYPSRHHHLTFFNFFYGLYPAAFTCCVIFRCSMLCNEERAASTYFSRILNTWPILPSTSTAKQLKAP